MTATNRVELGHLLTSVPLVDMLTASVQIQMELYRKFKNTVLATVDTRSNVDVVQELSRREKTLEMTFMALGNVASDREVTFDKA